jgi:hypothetical protein
MNPLRPSHWLKLVINSKWISINNNVIADKPSRLKAAHTPSTNSKIYGYSNLHQEHKELNFCNFFQPIHKLLSLI